MHGGIQHGTSGVFLGGGAIEARWAMLKAHYRFSTQRNDERSVSKVKRGITDARYKTNMLIEVPWKARVRYERRKWT
jgi:hypothetical protein